MKSPSGISAIVLAAGLSTRMGSLKQLLPFQGKPLLQTVLDTLRASVVDEIVLVLGFEADTIRSQLDLHSVRVVVNESYPEGMGTSLSAGISHVSPQSQAALVALADQPFLKSATVDYLIAKYLEAKPKFVIPTHKGFRGNPVLVDCSVFPELINLKGDVGCRAAFGNYPRQILKVPVNDVGILLDLDTAADLERAGKIDVAGNPESALLTIADLEGREVPDSVFQASAVEKHLVIVGSQKVARALVRFGALLKFSVTVVDLLASPADIPGADRVMHTLDFASLPPALETYVVVASQGRFDEDAVEQALLIEANYIAVVSNRRKAKSMLDSLAGRGISEQKLASVRVPAGLDIKAETPEEIALSIMAQIVSERNSRNSPTSK